METVTLGPLALTGVDAFGVEWLLEDLKGWGTPGGTLSPMQKVRGAGGWAGASYSQPRPMVATGSCFAPSAELASLALDRLIAAASLDDTLMTVAEPARSRWAMVRRDGEVLPSWMGDDAFSWSVQVVALDPRKLGTALSGSTGLPASSGGFTFPHVFPFAINSTVVSGQVNLTNPGNETGPVTLRIDGPCPGPAVAHTAGGRSQVISLAGLTLLAGEFLTINTESMEVLANGQVTRANWLTSRQKSGFDPGANTWSFSAASGTTGLLTVTATPADQ